MKKQDLSVPIMLAGMFIFLCLLFVISLFRGSVPNETAPKETTEPTVITEPESPYGWKEESGQKYYLNQDGSRATGWLELDGQRYYLNGEGILQTGWLEDNGTQYYLKPSGVMARGEQVIDGVKYFFTSSGQQILLVNRWNPVPEGYSPELVEISLQYSVEGSQVDAVCYDALLEMLKDCNKEAPRVCVVSSFRTNDYQTKSYNRKVNSYISQGYSQEEAEEKAATSIAVPGTSEHQLGLAVDIIDTRLWELDEEQANLPAQKWLMENCWRYGFILRYPEGKIDVTGIIYEPWHYRYVGKEVAQEIHQSGLTLEEYLQSITN